MTIFADQMRSTKAKIEAKGERCTWFKPGPDVVSSTPWQPDFTASPSKFDNISIVWVPIVSITRAGLLSDPMSDISTRWLKGLLAGFNLLFTPEYRDLIQRSDGSLWYLTRFDDLSPDGPTILYTFYARQ